MAAVALEVVKETRNVERFVATILPQDLQRTIQSLFLNEVEGQERLGAKATRTLVDGGRGNITTVKRRAQAFFSNKQRMKEAIQQAYTLLVNVTRRKSGAAQGSYMLYKNRAPIADMTGIARVVDEAAEVDEIAIVGPAVIYGRRLYWKPAGKQRKVRKQIGQWTDRKGVRVKAYGTHIEPMHRGVSRAIGRKFRDVLAYEMWIPLGHGTGPKREGWPSIAFRFR